LHTGEAPGLIARGRPTVLRLSYGWPEPPVLGLVEVSLVTSGIPIRVWVLLGEEGSTHYHDVPDILEVEQRAIA